MFRQLDASDDRFKTVTFKPGVNLIIAETVRGSTETDSRNGVGKSSLIEILHFLLGGNAPGSGTVLARDEVRDIEFRLKMDWPTLAETPLEVRRRPQNSSEISVSPPVDLLTPSDRWAERTLSEWQQVIERDLFSLPPEHAGVSGRAMLSLYIRRASSNSFNDSVKTHPRQSPAEASANIAYLLGLDWKLAAQYRDLAAQEAMRKKLQQAAKDPVWGRIVGKSSELRGQLSVVGQRVNELEQQIAAFRVVPEYERLQGEADTIGEHIRKMRAADIVDRRNLRDLEAAVADVSDPTIDYLEDAYAELGVLLSGAVVRSYEDVKEFHSSVIRNRRMYLEEEISSISTKLMERAAERERLGESQARVLRILSEGGALQALTALQQALAQERASLEALRHRYEAALAMEARRSEIRAERTALETALRTDLRERDGIVDEVSVRFLNYARTLYGVERDAYLALDPTSTHLKVVPYIESHESRGIGQMMIFCFDLTVAVTAYRNGRGPDFLVHDSHLFDGVDERQVARALGLAKDVVEAEGMQYIVTMNSDDFRKVSPYRAGLSDDVIPPLLTDRYDDGGLFGFRF